jgi:hypothetical protein
VTAVVVFAVHRAARFATCASSQPSALHHLWRFSRYSMLGPDGPTAFRMMSARVRCVCVCVCVCACVWIGVRFVCGDGGRDICGDGLEEESDGEMLDKKQAC